MSNQIQKLLFNQLNNEEIYKIIDSLTLEEIKEIKNLPYDQFVKIINLLNEELQISLSKKIGYPVFARLCMGELRHKFVLLQDGASAIILNENNQVLLQSRADRDAWSLPGGCQELGERFEETVIREVKEETNLDVKEQDLEFVGIVSGYYGRRNMYPNGDVVINNSALYCIKNYSGQLKWDNESKEMRFFDLDNMPENNIDYDLIEFYKNSLSKSR